MPAALSKVDEIKIAASIAQGASGQSIAEQLGICPNTVSRKKKALKPLIEALSVHYFNEAAPLTIDSTLKALKNANDILTHASNITDIREKTTFLANSKDFLAVTDKKEARVLVSMGVSPSPATSVFVQNLNVMNQTVLLPSINQLFGGQVEVCDESDIIDAELVDVRASDDGE